ncbi:MAG: hypothetical protein HQL54_14295, partial [Magnetococcales bacterium]|nr:hypothetical protein [Magnetococcales bacterium]
FDDLVDLYNNDIKSALTSFKLFTGDSDDNSSQDIPKSLDVTTFFPTASSFSIGTDSVTLYP